MRRTAASRGLLSGVRQLKKPMKGTRVCWVGWQRACLLDEACPLCMYICMYVCIYVCIYVCMYVRMFACMYVCYVCMYARTYVCTYVCMYVPIRVLSMFMNDEYILVCFCVCVTTPWSKVSFSLVCSQEIYCSLYAHTDTQQRHI
jgi:hypothetical protein